MRADHPRIRGEHRSVTASPTSKNGSSPHTRGALRDTPAQNVDARIIPAYAGSTIRAKAYDPNRRDHPRIRGEHRLFTEYERRGGGSSPHTRGAHTALMTQIGTIGIIPAYAGSTRCSRRATSACRDHPRIRGEHLGTLTVTMWGVGSSPHTRGAPAFRPVHRRRSGIIPAYAGSTARRP